jgi:hypothetical protein
MCLEELYGVFVDLIERYMGHLGRKKPVEGQEVAFVAVVSFARVIIGQERGQEMADMGKNNELRRFQCFVVVFFFLFHSFVVGG